jgi:hypothetical protein
MSFFHTELRLCWIFKKIEDVYPENIEGLVKTALNYIAEERPHLASRAIRLNSLETEELTNVKKQFNKSVKIASKFSTIAHEKWRVYALEWVEEIDDELSKRGIENTDSNALRGSLRKTVETISNLERDRDEKISENPAQADLIKKIYRQAIDRIREQ